MAWTVLAIRSPTASGYEDRLPQPDQPLREDDTLILAGPREDMTRPPAGDAGRRMSLR